MDTKVQVRIDKKDKDRIKVVTYRRPGGMSRWIRKVLLVALAREEKKR